MKSSLLTPGLPGQSISAAINSGHQVVKINEGESFVVWQILLFCYQIMFICLQFTGCPQHPATHWRLSWTHAGDREWHYEQMNDKHLFSLVTFISLKSCVLQQLFRGSVSFLREVCVLLCANLTFLRIQKTGFPDSNKHSRDQCGVLWKLSLGR